MLYIQSSQLIVYQKLFIDICMTSDLFCKEKSKKTIKVQLGRLFPKIIMMLRNTNRFLMTKTKYVVSAKEQWAYIKQMKPYILPFIHKDKAITHSLFKSYGLLMLSKTCFFGGPFFLKLGINSLTGAVTYGNPLLMFFAFGICYSGSVLFEQMRNLQTLKIINIALVQTTSKAYKHMLSLGPQFYFSGSQRHILFNLYKAQGAFQHNLKAFTQYFFPILLDISLSITLLLYYSNPLFALSFMACYSTYAVFTIRYSEKRRKGIKQFREVEKHIDFVTSQTFANYYNVKYFQKEQAELIKYQQALKSYYQKNYEVQYSLGVLNTLQRFIFGSGLTFNMMLAAYYTQKGLLTTGDIMMIQTLMLQFLGPLFILGSMYRSFEDNLIDIRKITTIMQTPALVQEGKNQISDIKGEITFRDVSFKYINQSTNILSNLNFTVKPKTFVAIVGRSGIGKTTILNLIFRLYDPNQGIIQLDGHNLKDLTFDFRKSISFVSQTPYLFNGTVMQNLKFGNLQISDQEIYKLTKRLNLHSIIMQLPQNYNTNVGEKGNIFSGGQKQRLSLIRALLKKSKILLLDQPTSSVDAQTEKIVGQILLQLKDTTRIMITHREGILNFCDQIIRVS